MHSSLNAGRHVPHWAEFREEVFVGVLHLLASFWKQQLSRAL